MKTKVFALTWVVGLSIPLFFLFVHFELGFFCCKLPLNYVLFIYNASLA